MNRRRSDYTGLISALMAVCMGLGLLLLVMVLVKHKPTNTTQDDFRISPPTVAISSQTMVRPFTVDCSTQEAFDNSWTTAVELLPEQYQKEIAVDFGDALQARHQAQNYETITDALPTHELFADLDGLTIQEAAAKLKQ